SFLTLPRPPRSPLFPYTTLFRSQDPFASERARVVIYLEGDLPSTPRTATLEQKNGRFAPDTQVIAAGSAVSFPNLDPVFHNVFSDRKSTRLNSSHVAISYAVFCL